MRINKPLIEATFISRYKRFLCDVKLPNGKILTVHCPNSGSMKSCYQEGWKVLISDSQNPKRKLRYTLEMLHNEKCWIGINTMLPNKIVKEAIEEKLITELSGYKKILSEQKYGKNSRIDLLLENEDERCYVEIKNVTLIDNQYYLFPDAVTERGQKHLDELIDIKKNGNRAVMFFLIQRNDANIFKPANSIDPVYSEKLKKAYKAGVEIIPYVADVNPPEIKIDHKTNFELG